MAVANSEGDSITIFTTESGATHSFRKVPTFTIKSSTHLSYVHDVAFSPCGHILAAAARDAHAVALFFRPDTRSAVFEQEPRCVVTGDGSVISNPASVSFHPSGEFLAIANRMGGGGITLHRCEQAPDHVRLEETPFQCISEDDFLEYGLSAPHAVDFSGDGAHMIVSHKRYFKSDRQQAESGLSVFGCIDTPPVRVDPLPKYTTHAGQACLHSVAWNPVGPYFAVANEGGEVEIYQWHSAESSASRIGTISIDRARGKEGAKGVAFTSDDGAELVVSTVLQQVLFFRDWASHS